MREKTANGVSQEAAEREPGASTLKYCKIVAKANRVELDKFILKKQD